MPAVYKFPPHPLCPGIDFKQNGCLLDEQPSWLQDRQPDAVGSARAERPLVPVLAAREDSGSSVHGAAAGAHHDAASRANHSSNSVSFDKPYKESRREREAAAQRELDGLELTIPYSMAEVPECTITSTGIHVSSSVAI